MSSSALSAREHRAAHRKAAILCVVLVAQAMAIIDLTIVNVAAPTIQRDLHASDAGLQMVVSGYVITYAMSLITGARLGDRIGHSTVLRAGLAAFTVASLACGLAANQTELIIFRLVQGLAAGAMMPQVMSLIQRTFPGPERARALGYYAAVVAVAAVVGQVAGGALVSADFVGSGWRPIFLINVPIGAVLAVTAGRRLPRGGAQTRRPLDPVGVLTSSAGVLTLVLPLVLGREEHWPLWCWASLAAAVVWLMMFTLVERRVDAVGGAPLVSGRVLRTPGLVAGASTIFLAMAANSGFLFAFALYLQRGLGLSAVHTGTLFAATALGSGLSALSWSRLPSSWHRWLVPVGMAGSAAAFLLLAPIECSGRLNSGWLIADLFATGVLFGLAYSPIIALALSHVPIADAADASGMVVTMVQLGQVAGVAAIGTVYLSLAHSPTHAIIISVAGIAACAAAGALSGSVLARTVSASNQ